MFLHIGNNNTINLKDVIGIFESTILKSSDENKVIIDKINDDDISTVIVAENKIYFSNISTNTIKKRIDANY